jgi:predicted porin
MFIRSEYLGGGAAMRSMKLAAAIAGLFAAPSVLAQAGNVQLYGRANVGIDSYSANGAAGALCGGTACDFKSRFRVYDNSSRVGLRGTEDLGSGLKAIFTT